VARRGPIIAAVGGIALIVLIVATIILPKASQVRERQGEVDVAKQQQMQLQLRLEQLRALQQEAPKNRRRLAQLDAEIPQTADLPGLIRMLNGIASNSGVDFMTIAPSSPTASQFNVSVIPTQLNVTGRFFAVDQYLYRLENMPRAAKVTSVQVSPTSGGLNYLSIALSVEFYTMDTTAGPGTTPSGGETGPTTTPPASGSAPTPAPSPATGATPAATPSLPGA
jgi:Tfp pilus assembly protein PilO